MTRAQLMEIATAAVKVSGVPFVTSSADKNAVANRRMTMFAELTRCLYSDAITFDLSPGGTIPTNGIYDLRDSSSTFSKKICSVDIVTIAGVPLLDHKGDPGLIPIKELRTLYRDYLSADPAPPKHACLISPRQLRIFPVPDASYADNYIAGNILPADIDTSAGGDNTALEFNEEDCEALAYFVAVGLIQWTASGESDYERMKYLSAPAAAHMQHLMSESSNQMEGPLVRGAEQRQGWVSIG
jgi:hypothetical protein